ncbi:hypothetical protein DU505_01055 [Billgrantia montanilacus]|uniref:Uncharacterized protein n=1 Tax=Billgrantia montanilacus TaxID=2282305 RepID=A0A368U5G5_9GAMM|nr:hypothetical protein DU505_01055 [Halomonas montanilacus]
MAVSWARCRIGCKEPFEGRQRQWPDSADVAGDVIINREQQTWRVKVVLFGTLVLSLMGGALRQADLGRCRTGGPTMASHSWRTLMSGHGQAHKVLVL